MLINKKEFIKLARFRSALRSFLSFSEAKAREAGLTPQQHQMMLAIKGTPERDWATPGEIADALQINHNGAVGLITRAESAGLVTRTVYPEDRRKVCVSLTALGEDVLNDLSIQHKQELEHMVPVLKELLSIIN